MTRSHPDLPVPCGEVVDGKYRVERKIGAGGMGCVVEATHLQLLQRVAMKFLLAGEEGEEAATRLVREARAAVALQSDHVARVLDVGTLPSGMPYLVMEYLEGQTLSQLLAGGARLAPEDGRHVAIETCRALGEAHRRGIVHRDVKPGNIFLARLEDGSSRVKVLDFGIAKVADPSMAVDPQLTGSEHALGTPRYMAPEQLSATRDVDARADVWAMGIVLYECLVGANPFARGGTAFEIGARILIESAPRVSASLPNVPPDLDAIVARCLERDRSARYRDANELLSALEGLLPATPRTRIGLGPLKSTVQLPPQVSLPPTLPKALRAPTPSAVVTALPSPAPFAPAPVRPRVAVFVAAGAAFVLVAAVGAITIAKRFSPKVDSPEVSSGAMQSVAPPPPTTSSLAPPPIAVATEELPPAATTTTPPATTATAKAAQAPVKRAPPATGKPSAIKRPPDER